MKLTSRCPPVGWRLGSSGVKDREREDVSGTGTERASHCSLTPGLNFGVKLDGRSDELCVAPYAETLVLHITYST